MKITLLLTSAIAITLSSCGGGSSGGGGDTAPEAPPINSQSEAVNAPFDSGSSIGTSASLTANGDNIRIRNDIGLENSSVSVNGERVTGRGLFVSQEDEANDLRIDVGFVAYQTDEGPRAASLFFQNFENPEGTLQGSTTHTVGGWQRLKVMER